MTFFEKNLTLAIIFEPREIGLSYFTCLFLVARPCIFHMCISCGKTFLLETFFYHVTLTLTFDLLLKILNFDHIFGTKSDRALILHLSIPCDKTFLLIPIFLYPSQTKFGGGVYRNHPVCLSVQSKHNLDHNFLTKSDTALILHKCIPCDKTFLSIPKFFTL